MADCYMVVGLAASYCKVQVSYGKFDMETKEVAPATQKTDIVQESGNSDDVNDEVQYGDLDTVGFFHFGQNEGRLANGKIQSILTMTPKAAESQPDVLINVFTSSMLGGSRRVC